LVLKLLEEHAKGVFESEMQWRIFGPVREEVTGDWRELHNELQTVYNPHKILDGMNKAYCAHGRRQKCRQSCGQKSLRKENTCKTQLQMGGY